MPCGLLLALCQMLDQLGKADQVQCLRAAIRAKLAAKDRTTADLGGTGNTQTLADALIEREPGLRRTPESNAITLVRPDAWTVAAIRVTE